MLVKLDHETPGIGVKIPKIFELPPPSDTCSLEKGIPSTYATSMEYSPSNSIHLLSFQGEKTHLVPPSRVPAR